MLFNGALRHQTRLEQVVALAINFTLMHILALFEKLTGILIDDILVSIIIEHGVLLKLTLIYLFFLKRLIHLQSRAQVLLAL